MDSEQTSGGLERTLTVVRRRALLVVLCALFTTCLAYAASTRQMKMYTATASLVFNNNQVDQQAAGLQPVNGNSAPAQQSTNVKLVQLGDIAAKTAAKLGHGLTKEDIAAAMSVSAGGESNVVNVSATAASPVLAANIANAYAALFVNEQQMNDQAYYASALMIVNMQLAALSPTERSGPAGVALEGRAQSLGVLAQLRNAGVEVAQTATAPKSPSSPKTRRNIVIGGVLGLLFGLGIAFLLERFDRRIKDPKDLVAIYGIPLLGVIPESAALSRSAGDGKTRGNLPPSVAEAFHLIRARLRYFNVDRDLRTLLVTSAAPQEGRTTLARHLASTAATMGSHVLLLEADLRHPTVAQQLGVKSGPGLSDLLVEAVPLSEATQIIELDVPSAHDSGKRALHVLVAGTALPLDPGAFMESKAMGLLLEHASSIYDLVVVDTPPLTEVSDGFPLLEKVDGVLIVGCVGHGIREKAERLHETLEGTGSPILGVVANRVKERGRDSSNYAYVTTTRPPLRDAPAHDADSSTEDSVRLQTDPSAG